MAGGRGTRLWPLTNNARPKAFLDPDGAGSSLLQRTISRLSGLTAPENIFVVAGRDHEKELRLQIRRIPKRNILLEPAGRSTLPCIGLAGLYMRRRNDASVMMVVPGEQLIAAEARFQDLMLRAAAVAWDHNCVVTLGIKPAFPATGFGYIQLGGKMSAARDIQVFRALGFTEKPDRQKAMEFLDSGKYLWNSGMFIWPTPLLFQMISKFAPDVHDALSVIDKAIGTRAEGETMEQVYRNMRSISIDRAIMEKAADTLVIPADIGWNDMGTWPEVSGAWNKDAEYNACYGQHVGIDSTGCVIYSPDKLVATIGVRDLVIVETPDGLLVCSIDRADDVKKLVEEKLKGDRRP